ncbi:MAG: RlmE family RNA methyltransferase [Candidatus Bathyarchaeota archaeon]|nr:MAG: RlmE family RNA methyltransferase [Candidatus Bathyarchaeota archaeon]
MSRRWLAERKREPYHRMAKEQGYRSRAAFKLLQLDQKYGFFKGARYVLDVGAAPGGWLQVASEAVDPDGLVVGVDIMRIESLEVENVRTIVADILEEKTVETIREMFPGRVDVVLSDLAPNVSGVWDLDQYRQIELARAALNLAKTLLKPRGWFVVKVFQGSEYDAFLKELRKDFGFVKIEKPKASRKESAETYVLCTN